MADKCDHDWTNHYDDRTGVLVAVTCAKCGLTPVEALEKQPYTPAKSEDHHG